MQMWRYENPERVRELNRKWAAENPEKVREMSLDWQKRNPDKVLGYGRAYYHRNKEKCLAANRDWVRRNPEKMKVKAAESQRRRLATPRGRINHRIRTQLNRCVSKTIETVGEAKRLLPYTTDQLMDHLERQFLPGMTWKNRSKWHIDHIIPLSHFHFTSAKDPEFQAAWALSNLRPMWAKSNLKKGARRLTIL